MGTPIVLFQDREEEAAGFQDRAAAVREVLEQYDRETASVLGGDKGGRICDWLNPTNEMRKVGTICLGPLACRVPPSSDIRAFLCVFLCQGEQSS